MEEPLSYLGSSWEVHWASAYGMEVRMKMAMVD